MEFAQHSRGQNVLPEIHPHAIHDWEHALLEKARAGLAERIAATREHLIHSALLAKAYVHCEQITRKNSKTFFTATALMPPAKRHAIRALYAFCRSCDDLMDVPSGGDASRIWMPGACGRPASLPTRQTWLPLPGTIPA